ncbi:MobV family relaxase [Tunicatimonas pelagia]|uniref:MobV family relaxase n=1 Tax=Tunicatimonas pelagia TaxID=931531 RepID=UPI0026655FDB|nr:MobV family relaxase [Tunicatimonas pelagia]WKN46532.1 MobV family relaxase [Tunicatimonas pelagia]
MGQFAVFHAMKGKGSGGQLGRHIDRMHQVKNADPSRTHLNQYAVLGKEGKVYLLTHEQFADHRRKGDIPDMYTSVKQRITEGYQGKTAIRKDAVRYVNLMLSGSPEQMSKLEQQGKLTDWMQANYRYVASEFGKENIVRFAMHLDEKTPHIHATVVPLTKDGRLSAKEYLFGHKEKLRGFQDRYAKAMEPFGLERGLKGSRSKHQTTNQYYRQQEHAVSLNLPTVKAKERRGMLGLGQREEYYEIDKASLESFVRAQKEATTSAQQKVQISQHEEQSTRRRARQWQKHAEQLADHVDVRDKLLKQVAEGKRTPEQLKELLDQAQQNVQQRNQRRNRGQGLGL